MGTISIANIECVGNRLFFLFVWGVLLAATTKLLELYFALYEFLIFPTPVVHVLALLACQLYQLFLSSHSVKRILYDS